MKKLFIAGNWKMNLSRSEAVELASALVERIGAVEEVDLGVFPPFVYLTDVGSVLDGSRIALGAQNMYYEDDGAYTGEISGQMLVDTGCRCVIVGHSERRHVIGETDETINRKVIKALSDGLDVILCVGELLEQREADKTLEVVSKQVRIGLESVSKDRTSKLTIAYEPVWAIGTGVTASPEQAQQVHQMIRQLLTERYDREVSENLRIQYGGSVNPSNARELLSQPDVDGALVGGASLKADDFAAIVEGGM